MGSENYCESQQNLCKSVTYLTASLSYQDLGRRTETTHRQRVGRCESHGYCVRAGGGHFEHMLK